MRHSPRAGAGNTATYTVTHTSLTLQAGLLLATNGRQTTSTMAHTNNTLCSENRQNQDTKQLTSADTVRGHKDTQPLDCPTVSRLLNSFMVRIITGCGIQMQQV